MKRQVEHLRAAKEAAERELTELYGAKEAAMGEARQLRAAKDTAAAATATRIEAATAALAAAHAAQLADASAASNAAIAELREQLSTTKQKARALLEARDGEMSALQQQLNQARLHAKGKELAATAASRLGLAPPTALPVAPPSAFAPSPFTPLAGGASGPAAGGSGEEGGLRRYAALQARLEAELARERAARASAEDRYRTASEELTSERRASVLLTEGAGNLEYLKNVLLRFLEMPEADGDALLQVISTFMQFSEEEVARLQRALTRRRESTAGLGLGLASLFSRK